MNLLDYLLALTPLLFVLIFFSSLYDDPKDEKHKSKHKDKYYDNLILFDDYASHSYNHSDNFDGFDCDFSGD